jgi:hypothetical protein
VSIDKYTILHYWRLGSQNFAVVEIQDKYYNDVFDIYQADSPIRDLRFFSTLSEVSIFFFFSYIHA